MTLDCKTLFIYVTYLPMKYATIGNCKTIRCPLDLIHVFFISILIWLTVAYDHHGIRIKFTLAKSEIIINYSIVRQYNVRFGHSELFGAEC